MLLDLGTQYHLSGALFSTPLNASRVADSRGTSLQNGVFGGRFYTFDHLGGFSLDLCEPLFRENCR